VASGFGLEASSVHAHVRRVSETAGILLGRWGGVRRAGCQQLVRYRLYTKFPRWSATPCPGFKAALDLA